MGGKSVFCLGIAVLDITAVPVPKPDKWREKQRIDSISLQTGGDAANQSIHLSSLGIHTYFCGVTGEDSNGFSLRAALESRGVDISYLTMRRDVPTGTALLLIDPAGERNIFSVKGAHSTICAEDLPLDIPEDCGAVSLGSLFGMPLLEEEGLHAFLEKARKRGIPVFADLDSGHVEPGVKRIERLLPLIDYLVPSDYDILPLTGQKTREDAAAWLKERGVGNVIVKCGAEGCEIFGKDERMQIPAPAVEVADTTGAGDCMTAALIARILAGDTLPRACRYACAAGSLNTMYLGASSLVLRDSEIRGRFKEYLLP